MQSKALYRLPYADTYTTISCQSDPIILDQIGSHRGFLFAPFCVDDEHPMVLIPPETVTHASCPAVQEEGREALKRILLPTDDYATDFQTFHSAIREGQFRKLVLARSESRSYDKLINSRNDKFADTVEIIDADRLFFTACQLFPRAMVMLISTPMTGTWLIATPEVLLRSEDNRWLTMALAGTMPYSAGYPQWSAKNLEEQHIVEEFIDNAIAPFALDVVKDGPQTVRAAELIHLCTTFRFHLKADATMGNVVTALHPTPAVSGLPRQEAIRFIRATEHCDRAYYSGFAGPVDIDDATNLYVSLRCMQIYDDHCALYAGGGIMPDSELMSEWNETENKLSTMRSCIQTSSM